MKSMTAILMTGMLSAGCASLPPEPAKAPAKTLLDQADARMTAEDYSGALALYAQFVQADPDNAHAARARATQTALDRLLAFQTELERVKQDDELPRLRRELLERHSEADRLKAEIAKLRADLERLRNIDLQNLPGIKK
jgi:thioredoxin-like negative regulator of GroEL